MLMSGKQNEGLIVIDTLFLFEMATKKQGWT